MSRVVVVTGASGAVGRACAVQFGARGDAVALVARGRSGLEELAAELTERGVRTLVVPTDVADPDAVEYAVARIEDELGPVDVWVNAASVSGAAPFEDTAPEDFRRSIEVSYLGVVHATMSVLERMKERNRGTVLQVTSALAYRASAYRTACSGAQHAVQGFTDALRSELEHDGSEVRVRVVHVVSADPMVAARSITRSALAPARRTRASAAPVVPVLAGARC